MASKKPLLSPVPEVSECSLSPSSLFFSGNVALCWFGFAVLVTCHFLFQFLLNLSLDKSLSDFRLPLE